MKQDAEKLLRKIGIEEGLVILDFGCGSGSYSIPAAKIVCQKGKIYALDKDENALNDLMHKAESFGLRNIQEERPIGIITERDVLQKVVEHCLDPSLCKAKEIMTTPILTAGEDMSLDDAAKLMATRKVKKIPIVRNQTLVGIVTATDLIEKNPTMVHILGRA